MFCCAALKPPAIAVLCVDDNPRVLQALRTALVTAGFSVETAASGWEALKRLRGARDQFRVVVTDIRMPQLNGVGMIRQSRALGYQGPFVVWAAGLLDDDRAALTELGVQQMIDKTAGVAPLIAAVEQAAATYNPAPRAPAPPAVVARHNHDDEASESENFDEEFDDGEGRRYHGPAKGGKR
jgi:CheY-like chemotaxis protein